MSRTSHPAVTITLAEENDFPAIGQIYAPYVQNTTVSLEEIPPDTEEMKSRWSKSRDAGLPYLVAKIDDRVIGYAYAFPYRTRSAYRFTAEESVYVANSFKGAGIGYKLLSEVIKLCSEKGYKQLVAIIAGVDNIPSIKFHKALGFKETGRLLKVGFKFGQWVDTVIMQREL